MKLKDEEINQVAKAFLAGLLRYLGQKKFDAAVKLNLTRRPGICHFHDYCDANVFMAEAIKQVRGLKREVSLQSDRNLALWNAAWDRAHEISSPRPKAAAWYVTSTGNHQGLVISDTGENIAVVYDKANAPLVGAAPALLAALHKIDANAAESAEWIRNVIRAAIAKATA